MPDAWVGHIYIAIAKGRTAAFFSSNENALTSRIIGVLSQAHNPDGTGGAAPLWASGAPTRSASPAARTAERPYHLPRRRAAV